MKYCKHFLSQKLLVMLLLYSFTMLFSPKSNTIFITWIINTHIKLKTTSVCFIDVLLRDSESKLHREQENDKMCLMVCKVTGIISLEQKILLTRWAALQGCNFRLISLLMWYLLIVCCQHTGDLTKHSTPDQKSGLLANIKKIILEK